MFEIASFENPPLLVFVVFEIQTKNTSLSHVCILDNVSCMVCVFVERVTGYCFTIFSVWVLGNV